MQYRLPHSRHGFTLIELSIVLVIIALVAAGILSGRAVIENSALQSVVADFDQYRQAALSYRDKYRQLPGDHDDASSITSAGYPCNGGMGLPPPAFDYMTTATCNGDGDGVIGAPNGDPLGALSTSYTRETLWFWQHLSNVNLIQGQYNGYFTWAANQITPGINVPKSQVPGAAFNPRFFPTNTVTTGYFVADYGHVFFFGKPRSDGTLLDAGLPYNTAALTPEQAKSIDLKIDDGKPGLGKVLTTPYSVSNTCATNTPSETAADYDGTVTDTACHLIFITGF